MDTLIYVIIATLILLYVIDKKEPIPPNPVTPIKGEGEVVEISRGSETNEEKRQEIYKDIFKSIKEINPLKTYRVWTYIEIPNESRNVQLSYQQMGVPVYFQKCIDLMKKNVPELVILTPININKYLPDFNIDMKHTSEIPLKLRIDILFTTILENYGGLCISPGTIIYDINRALSMLKSYEIVTFGGSPSVLQAHNNLYYPNSYVLGSQEKSSFIQEYKRLLLLVVRNTYRYDLNVLDNSDILAKLINELRPSQFHFGTEYDGSYNSKLEKIPLSTYMGTHSIDFQNKERISLITIPYDTLLKTRKYQWFLNLSEEQFMQSNLELKNLLQNDI
tara:strand:+ start:84 stop:1085 length:1002 start_codon:yes stop_codon:yes gene_type:complete